MKKVDVIIIGGGPAGYTTALTAKNLYPDKSIVLIRREEKVLIPCAIPYLFNTIKTIDQNILPDDPLIKLGVDIVVDEVTSINLSNRIVKTSKGLEFEFNRLVLATGSKPVELKVDGSNLKNVFYIIKDYNYLKNVIETVKEANDIVIIGGGFVGMEIADDLCKTGKNITIVEMLPHCLLRNFDEEFAILAEEELKSRGVNIKTNCLVTKIEGNSKVEKVKLSTGEDIKADVVIVSIGVRPNVDLAKSLGLKIGSLGGIEVDYCRRTSNPLIYAVGDCVERPDFITGKSTFVQLASVATSDARIAAMNLFTLSAPCKYVGSIGAFSTKIGDLTFACVGFTESRAKIEGVDYVVGYSEAIDKHPTILPGGKKIKLKIIVSKPTQEIIGAEIVGGSTVAEYVNTLGMLILNRMKLTDILSLQVATHPWLTPSPVAYTLHTAALDALKKLKK